jgi:hypothetical protein
MLIKKRQRCHETCISTNIQQNIALPALQRRRSFVEKRRAEAALRWTDLVQQHVGGLEVEVCEAPSVQKAQTLRHLQTA